MPTTLTLSNPASVAWAGSTTAWTNVANAITDDGSYASASSLLPGSKTEYIRCVIDAPGTPFVSKPATLSLSVNAWLFSSTDYYTDVADVVAQLGLAGGPAGTNASSGTLLTTSTGAYYSFSLPTDGISLAQLNAGSARLFLAYQAIPTGSTTYNAGNWSVTVTPTSPSVTNGAPTLHTVTNFAVVATWIGVGDAPNYVIVQLAGTADGAGTATAPFAISFSGTASVDNGLGGTASGNIEAPTVDWPPNLSASSTVKRRLTVTAGIATYGVTMDSTVSLSAYGAGNQCQITHTLTATVVQPTSSEARVDAISLVAPDVTISPGAIQMLNVGTIMDRVPELLIGSNQI